MAMIVYGMRNAPARKQLRKMVTVLRRTSPPPVPTLHKQSSFYLSGTMHIPSLASVPRWIILGFLSRATTQQHERSSTRARLLTFLYRWHSQRPYCLCNGYNRGIEAKMINFSRMPLYVREAKVFPVLAFLDWICVLGEMSVSLS